MIFSRDRILTTHVGSLPRNEKLSDLLVRQEGGEAFDAKEMAAEMDKAVAHVVGKQAEAGIDIGNDGEQQRVGFQTYVPQRMSGFAGVSKRRRGREFEEFPELVASLMRRFPNVSRQQNAPECQGELKYLDIKPLENEIARFKKIRARQIRGNVHDRALARHHFFDHARRVLRFAGQISHGALARDEERVPGDSSRPDCLLQIDAPDLAMDRTMMYRDLDDAGFVKAVERHVQAINEMIEGVPRDRARLHVCYGNWEGPHIHDIPLEKILPALYQAKVGALSIEFSNPRHAHEYAALKKHPLPKDMLLIPGVVETTSNFVEHPEVVARRIEEAVAAVGERERVIASTDCGFGTFTNREWVIEPAVWLKLKSIRQGADIASARLWGKKSAA